MSRDDGPNQTERSLPYRFFAPDPRVDDDGFLDRERTSGVVDFSELLKHPISVVSAPPWSGKTYFSRAAENWARCNGSLRFGDRVALAPLEEYDGAANVPPRAWWDRWRQASTAQPSLWLIDALDEADPRLHATLQRILRELGEAHRRALRVVVFTRPREWLRSFCDELAEIYRGTPPRRVHLAPLTRKDAENFLGRDAFERVISTIRNCGLQSIAGYPRVLGHLGNLPAAATPDIVAVWRGILMELVKDPQHRREEALLQRSEPELRFEVSARLAAVLSISSRQAVYFDAIDPDTPTIASVFPAGAHENLERCALRDALGLGGLFRDTPTGAYRFAQRHLQDWMCAFGLQNFSLRRLQSALADGWKPYARHHDMLMLLRRISADSQVRTWLQESLNPLLIADAKPWDLNEALTWLDRLEELARRSPWDLQLYHEELGRLDAPGLGLEFAIRLADTNRKPASKNLLIDVAAAIGSIEVVGPAVEILMNPSHEGSLRLNSASFVAKFASPQQLKELEGPAARARNKTGRERRIKAKIISGLLDKGVWTPAEAARHAPLPSGTINDVRGLLMYRLAHEMKVGDAPSIMVVALKRITRTLNARRTMDTPPESLETLLQAALNLLKDCNDLAPKLQRGVAQSLLLVRRLASGYILSLDVSRHLCRFRVFRRYYYRQAVEQSLTGEPSAPHPHPHGLQPADLAWLVGHAETHWPKNEAVWVDVFHLMSAEAEPGHDTAVSRAEILQRIETAIPGLAARIEAAQEVFRRNCEEQARQIEQMKLARKKDTPHQTLEDAVMQVIGAAGRSAADRMRQLSSLCFQADGFRYENIDGDWPSLDVGRQAQVLAACKDGLEVATPTAIPDGDTYPRTVAQEARAFAEVARAPEFSGWLDDRMIRKWLPAIIRSSLDLSMETVRRCEKAAPLAAAEVLLEGIEQELRSGSRYAYIASRAPVELWTKPFVEELARLVQRPDLNPQSRADLLALLSQRQPTLALPVAAGFATAVAGSPPNPLWSQGLSSLLALKPDAAWPLIESEYRSRGKDVLLDLSSLWGGVIGPSVSLDDWPTDRLESLARMLLQSYPRVQDPQLYRHGFHICTPETSLRELRQLTLARLLRRDERAFLRLADLDSSVREWHAAHKARSAATELLIAVPHPAICPGSETDLVPLAMAVQLMEHANFRVLRSDDDLMEVLLEVLKCVEHDVGYDLKMLYAAPQKRAKGTEKPALPRKHLMEEAVQAYLRRRLTDLLPRFVREGTNVEFLCICEDQVRYRRRLDLRVVAPRLSGGLATVVIEVKWSDNVEVETSLETQLGEKYLLGEGRSHGIFLVGWSGWWRQKGKRRSRDRNSVASYLADQARRFCDAEGRRHLRIRPVVLGLDWREHPAVPGGGGG